MSGYNDVLTFCLEAREAVLHLLQLFSRVELPVRDFARPSRTRRFAESVAASLAKQAGLQHTVFDVEDLGTSLATARSVADLDPAARR